MKTIKPLIKVALMTLMTANAAHVAGAAEESTVANPAVEVLIPVESRFLAVPEQAKPDVRLLVRNQQDTKILARLEVLTQLADGKETSYARDIDLDPKSEQQVSLPAETFSRYGIYKVRYRLVANRQTSEWTPDVIAVYPKNAPAKRGESALPIGFASGYTRVTPRLLNIAASLGFEFHRLEPYWGRVQPQKDVWNWGELDSYMNLVEEHGIRPQLLTTSSANWAAKSHRHPPRSDAWHTWISALANRYKGRVEFWEVWNEPDIGFFDGTINEYNEVQRVAFDAIKAVSSKEIVTSGGFADMNHGQAKPGIMEASMREYPRAFDWFAYHKHGAFPEFYNDLRVQIPALQQRTGAVKMPIVFTETGMDTRSGQRFQAMTLMKKMSYAAAIGAKSYVWYNIMDRSGDDAPNRVGLTYGLITNPPNSGNFATIENVMKPKESLVAAATAIRELRNRPQRQIWAQDGRNFAFLFSNAQSHLLSTWNEDVRSPESVWVVESGTNNVSRMDLFGNLSALPVVQGRTLVSLSDPQYYKFERGAKAPELVGPLVVTPKRITPGSDNIVNFDLELRNPLNRIIRVTPEISGTDFRVLAPPVTYTIAPRATAKLPVRVAATPGHFGDNRPLEVTLRMADLPWAPTLKLPIVFNTINASRGQRIAVRDLSYITNKNEHDPHSLHLLWSSHNDLSVDATYNADAATDTLKLKLDVTDNQHHSAPVNSEILDGDAVEIGWATASGATGRMEIAGEIGTTPRVNFGDATKHQRALRSASITRDGNRTTYELVLDTKEMGVLAADLKDGFRFNFAVHDNDGAGPESWISPMQGLGGAKVFAPTDFPQVNLQ